MRIRAVLALLAVIVCAACSVGGLFKSYEYEEEMYLSLDGTATLYVNSSVAALDALRGASFDVDPATTPDRNALSAWFETPETHVTRVTFSRRSNRRFVHVRMDVAHVDRLGQSRPFAWSSYRFAREGELFIYRQTVGPAAGKDVGNVGWRGNEIVAFRMHLPSKIAYHNAGAGNPQRGNILAWEQLLTDRLDGRPIAIEVRMDRQSILYTTLWLFAGAFGAAVLVIGLMIWLTIRKGAREAQTPA